MSWKEIKGAVNQKKKNVLIQSLRPPHVPMKSRVKFDSPQNISGALQQDSVPALSSWGENVKKTTGKKKIQCLRTARPG